jgi:hypothetical protein
MLSHRGRDTLETPPQSTLYEVRCYQCRCSFAPGTKRCLHCGGKLGPPPELPFGRAPLDAPADASAEGEEIPVPSFARAVLWVVSAGVAIALSALQTCANR